MRILQFLWRNKIGALLGGLYAISFGFFLLSPGGTFSFGSPEIHDLLVKFYYLPFFLYGVTFFMDGYVSPDEEFGFLVFIFILAVFLGLLIESLVLKVFHRKVSSQKDKEYSKV